MGEGHTSTAAVQPGRTGGGGRVEKLPAAPAHTFAPPSLTPSSPSPSPPPIPPHLSLTSFIPSLLHPSIPIPPSPSSPFIPTPPFSLHPNSLHPFPIPPKPCPVPGPAPPGRPYRAAPTASRPCRHQQKGSGSVPAPPRPQSMLGSVVRLRGTLGCALLPEDGPRGMLGSVVRPRGVLGYVALAAGGRGACREA